MTMQIQHPNQIKQPPSMLVKFSAGKIPLDVRIARNHLLSRFTLEMTGVVPWSIALSRNNYERLEHALAPLNFWTVGILLPLALEVFFNKRFSTQLIKKFKLKSNSRPLGIPLEYLEQNKYQQIQKSGKLPTELIKFGIPNAKAFTPKLRDALLFGKNLFIWVDLTLLGLKGVMFYYGRNWITEKLSGKKGFVGIFNDADKNYREKLTKKYDQTKQKRLYYTTIIGLIASSILPLALYRIVKSPIKLNQGIVGFIKRNIGYLNYSNAIYMSKWVLLYATLFHYNIPKLVFARDKHEFREALAKSAVYDTLFFLGDDIFAGLAAKFYQKHYAKRLKGFKLYTNKKILGLTLPVAKHFNQVYESVNCNTRNIAFQLSRKVFWTGMLTTTLSLSIMLPLLNMWYTHKRVLQEQGIK